VSSGIDYSKPIDFDGIVEDEDEEQFSEIVEDSPGESLGANAKTDDDAPTLEVEQSPDTKPPAADNPFTKENLELPKEVYDPDAVKAAMARISKPAQGAPTQKSAKAGKRSEGTFAMVHEAFWEPLSRAESPTTLVVFFFLLREWFLKKEPVTISNTALSFISRKRKYRAVADIERLGVGVVERHGKKSPRVTPVWPKSKIKIDE
jgi:hypothetical protein